MLSLPLISRSIPDPGRKCYFCPGSISDQSRKRFFSPEVFPTQVGSITFVPEAFPTKVGSITFVPEAFPTQFGSITFVPEAFPTQVGSIFFLRKHFRPRSEALLSCIRSEKTLTTYCFTRENSENQRIFPFFVPICNKSSIFAACINQRYTKP